MEDDQNLYDEFGNYIGPEMDVSEESDEDDDRQDERDEDRSDK